MHLCNPPIREDRLGMSPTLTIASFYKWEKNLITYRFLDGDKSIWNKVVSVIDGPEFWSNFCNMNFKWDQNSTNADVRIAFVPGGSWSYVGSGSRYRPQNESSMNFGWFDADCPYGEIVRVTLHEWGHALGFVHEHDSPMANLKFDMDKIYAAYASSHGMTPEEIKATFMTPTKMPGLIQNEYDPESIMHYGINPDWLADDETRKVNNNGKLSTLDKKWAAKFYGVRAAPRWGTTFLPIVLSGKKR
jgi:serralysin